MNKIVPYSKEYKKGVIDVLQFIWGNTEEYRYKRFEWQYEHNPIHSEILALIAIDEHNKVIGFRGWVPATFSKDKLLLVRAADAVVHKNARRKGVFEKLTYESLNYLESKGCKIILNLSSNRYSNPGYRKLGWKILCDFDIWYKYNAKILGKADSLKSIFYKNNNIKFYKSLPKDINLNSFSDRNFYINLDTTVLNWLSESPDTFYFSALSSDVFGSITSIFIFKLYGRRTSLAYFNYSDHAVARKTFKESLKRIDSNLIGVWAFALPREKIKFLKSMFFLKIPFYKMIKKKQPALIKTIFTGDDNSASVTHLENINNWEINNIDSF